MLNQTTISTQELQAFVNKGKKRLKIHIYTLISALFLSGICVAIALIFQNQSVENEADINVIIFGNISAIMFGIAAIFLGLAILCFFLYFKLIRSGWHYHYLMATRLLNYRVFIAGMSANFDNSVNSSKLQITTPISQKLIIELLKEKLKEYTQVKLSSGILYYTLASNSLNTAKSSVDAFFIVDEQIINSYQIHLEGQQIKKFSKEIGDYLFKELPQNYFTHVVVMFLESEITKQITEFYHNFYGLVDLSSGNAGKLISARIYTYLGINSITGQLYTFLPLNSDSGNPANLENLIIEELLT